MTRPHPHLYEISTAPWLHELSQREGRSVNLGTVPPGEWDRLKDLGFDLVWLMGVWQKSRAGCKIFQESKELFPVYDAALPGWTPEDIVGSPYSISSYAPDPAVGAWDDLDSARAELARRGIGLILDFVPNHVGPDHSWVKERPEYFVLGSDESYASDPDAYFEIQATDGNSYYIAKGRDPFFAPWKDTVQLNYFNPATREAMIDTLTTIGEHCDGVRCDMAMLVLNDIFQKTWSPQLKNSTPEQEFWSEARPATAGMIWIAEAYWDTEWTLQQLGFDYVYDKRLYDRSRFSSAQDIRLHLTADLDYQRKLVRFVENHDEPRATAEFGRGRLFAATALFATLPGLKLFHHGQLEGRKIHLPVQMIRTRPEEVDREILDFHLKLLRIIDQPSFHQGEWRLLELERFEDDTYQNLIAFAWTLETEVRLVVVNFGAGYSQGRVRLGDVIDPRHNYRLEDLLGGEAFERSGAEMEDSGLHIVLPAYRSHILAFNRADQ